MTSENNSVPINLDEIDPTLPSGALEQQMREWFGDYAGSYATVLQVDPSLNLPYVCKARELRDGDVRLNESDRYNKSLPLRFPEGVSTAILCGGVLRTDTATWLRAPTQLGKGGMYDVTWAMDLATGEQTILRIAHPDVSAGRVALDIHALQVCRERPEIPHLKRVERALGIQGVIVLEPFDKPFGLYGMVDVRRLSPVNLYRLVRLQWYALKRWTQLGLVYVDWQSEEMVRWRHGTQDQHDVIEGFREVDFQPNPEVPNDITGEALDSVAARIDLALADRAQIINLRPLYEKLDAIDKELRAIQIEINTPAEISEDEFNRMARKELAKELGWFMAKVKEVIFNFSGKGGYDEDLKWHRGRINNQLIQREARRREEAERKLASRKRQLLEESGTQGNILLQHLHQISQVNHITEIEPKKIYESLTKATSSDGQSGLLREVTVLPPTWKRFIEAAGYGDFFQRMKATTEDKTINALHEALEAMRGASRFYEGIMKNRIIPDDVMENASSTTSLDVIKPDAGIKTFLTARVRRLVIQALRAKERIPFIQKIEQLQGTAAPMKDLIGQTDQLLSDVSETIEKAFPDEKPFFVKDTNDDIRIEQI